MTFDPNTMEKDRDRQRHFRNKRAVLGLQQASSYIPSNRLEQFNLYCESLRVERYKEILQLPVADEVRQVLAESNRPKLPNVERIHNLVARVDKRDDKLNELYEEFKLATERVKISGMQANDAVIEEEYTRFKSELVTYSHEANYLANMITDRLLGGTSHDDE